MKHLVILSLILFSASIKIEAQNSGEYCSTAVPLCNGIVYSMNTSTVAEVGPNYGCLYTQPNPKWLYLNVSQSGNFVFSLNSPTGNDIDFAAWGPFTSPVSPCTAQLTANCTTCPNNTVDPYFYPSGNMVDCSYDPSYNETFHISNAFTGQYYLLMVTNYSNMPGNINIVQTNLGQAGAGTLSYTCSGCVVTNIEIDTAYCNGVNSYYLGGSVVFTTPPSTGTLIVSHQPSGLMQVLLPPFVSPLSFSFPSLPTSGTNHTITAYFSDESSCAYTKTYSKPLTPTLTFNSVKPSCGQSNGGIVVTIAGGQAPYDYIWSTGQTVTGSNNTSNLLNNIPSGTYSVTVISAGDCGVSSSLILTDNNAATVALSVSQPVTCHSSCSAQVTATVQQAASPPYDYYWSSGQIVLNSSLLSNTQTGLCAGNYTVTLTNDAGCNSYAQVSVADPPVLTCTLNPVQPGCAGNNGQITALPSGGVPPYSYIWSSIPAQTGQTATNLSSGTYSVTVTDNNDCQIILSETLTAPLQFSLNTTHTNNICYAGHAGTATVTVNGGVGPFTYIWNSVPPQTTSTASNLAAGIYTVTVSASNGCTSAAFVNIGQPSVPIDVIVTVSQNASCFGANDGQVSVTASNGLPPYQYIWSNGTSGNTANYNAGTHTVTVTDANLCNNTDTFIITQPAAILLSPLQINPDCGLSNGSAVVSISSGGTTPYSYLWSNGFSQTNTSSSTSLVSGLSAGSYTVTIVNSNSCTTTYSYTLVNSNAPVMTMHSLNPNLCNGDCIASVYVSLSGTLNPPFSYNWSTGESQSTPSVSDTVSGLCAGNYYVTISDNAGCVGIGSHTVTEPAVFTSQIAQVSPVLCNGQCNGVLTATTGGNNPGPLTYLWMPGANTTPTASGFCAGTATVIITNANGCTTTSSFALSQPSLLSSAITTVTDNYCTGNGNGTATVAGSGGTPPYQYYWNSVPPQTTATASGLVQGTYTAIVTDSYGCTDTAQATVNNQSGSAINLNIVSVVNVSCYGDCDGSAMASVSGGYPPFTYLWSTGNTTFYASNLCAGTYILTVTDSHGCYSTKTVTITQPAQAVSQFVYGTNQGTAVFVNQSSPGIYFWNFGDGATSTDTNPSHDYLISGNYNACLTVYTSCDSVTSCQLVNIVIVSNVTIPEEGIKVFPNPAGGILNISFGDIRMTSSEIKLTDHSGRVVFSGMNKDKEMQINVTHLATGMYFLSVDGKMLKVIIQH